MSIQTTYNNCTCVSPIIIACIRYFKQKPLWSVAPKLANAVLMHSVASILLWMADILLMSNQLAPCSQHAHLQ